MTPRLALIFAVACGTVAVALVAVDLQFGVHVELQENVDGEWVAVSGNFEERYLTPARPGCPGPELRLVVNNDRLFRFEGPVDINYFDHAAQEQVTVLSETWNIEARGVQDHVFTIPESAFQEETDGFKPGVFVNVQVAEHYLSTCVQEAA